MFRQIQQRFIFMLPVIVLNSTNYTNMYSNSISLYKVHSYMFRHTCVILMELKKIWFTPACLDMCHPQGVSKILVHSCLFRHVILREFQRFRFTPACFDMSSSGSLKNFGSLLRVSTCVILRELKKIWFTPACFDMCHPQGV